jgi:AhpD family alkylhydroperoxidase
MVAAHHDERAGGSAHRVRIVPSAAVPRIEPGAESSVEFGEVLGQRELCLGRLGIHHIERDGRSMKESIGGCQSGGQLAALASRERIDESSGQLIGALVEPPPLSPTLGRRSDDTLATISGIPRKGDQTFVLELTEQPTEISRVETESATKVGDVRAVGDLEEQSGGTEWTAGVEVRLGEHTDALGERAIETAKRRDLIHIADFSQLLRSMIGPGNRTPAYDGVMSEHTHGKVVLDGVIPLGHALRQAIPDVYKGYAALSSAAMAPGALDAKTKELIALGISVTLRCDGCIASHARGAAHAGASREEAAEAIGVAILLNGGPGTVYGPRAFDAFCEFAEAAHNAAKGDDHG